MDFGVLAGHAIDAVGSVSGGLFGANQARKNRAFQERMYEKAKNDNIEFWKMQNEYDLPSAQLQRLKDAGLNPLLAYGQGGNVQNVASGEIATPSSPHGAQANVSFNTNFGLAVQQAKLLRAQKENIEIDSEKKLQEALLSAQNIIKTREDTENTRQDSISKRNQNFNFWEKWKLDKEAVLAENNLKTALADTEVSKRNEIEVNIKHLEKEDEYIDSQISNADKLTDAQIREIDERISSSRQITAKTLASMDAEIRLKVAEAYEARVRALLMDDPEYKKAFKEKEMQAVKNMIAQGNAQQIENALREYEQSLLPDPKGNFFERTAYLYNKVLTWVLNPIGHVIGDALRAVK